MSTVILNVGECLTAELPDYWDINCEIENANGASPAMLGMTWEDFTTSRQDIDTDSGLEILFSSESGAGAGTAYNAYILQTMDYKQYPLGTTLKGYTQITNLHYKLGGKIRFTPGSARNVGRLQVYNITDDVVTWEVVAQSGNSNVWYWYEGSSGVIMLDVTKEYTIRLQTRDSWVQLQWIAVSWEYITLELERMVSVPPHSP